MATKDKIKDIKRGALHKELGVPEGEKIGEKRLNAAKANAKKTGDTKEMKRVVFAENFGHKK